MKDTRFSTHLHFEIITANKMIIAIQIISVSKGSTFSIKIHIFKFTFTVRVLN